MIAGELRIEVIPVPGGPLRVEWFGRSNDSQPHRVLDPLFKVVLVRAKELGVGVELAFEKLEFFNSSTIAELVRFIEAARVENVALRLVFDARLKWQKLSFDALRVFEQPNQLMLIDVGKTANA